MYLCYIDESGTSAIPGNTSHFVLAGLSIPVWHWRDCDQQINTIKQRYLLGGQEIHTAWLLRSYLEQSRIPDFKALSYQQRRYEVTRYRNQELLRLQNAGNSKRYKQVRKNYRNTEAYIHLNYEERTALIADISQCISGWGFARLFAECIDKLYFDPVRTKQSIDEQAFEQVVSRFEIYLQNVNRGVDQNLYGLVIHDNNVTVARKHTELMHRFHRSGTLWTKIENIIETPLFVDSQLTSMVQIADLCSYALRRYLENGEEDLFDRIFERADRYNNLVVGVRHFSSQECHCKICKAHTR